MQPTSLRTVKITACSADDPDFRELYLIFSATLCPAMSFREFKAFYCSVALDYIDVTFICEGKDAIGFCAAAFYKDQESKRKTSVIARAATGILPGRRGGKLPRWNLFAKYMRYKIRHPFAELLLTIYVANPLIYAMICRYTNTVYPRMTVEVDEGIKQIKSKILASNGLSKREISPFVVKIHFCVQLGDDILKRVFKSEDIYVRFYLSVNPGFQSQYGLLTIVPVTWENILLSCLKLGKGYLIRKGFIRKNNWCEQAEKLRKADDRQQKRVNFPLPNNGSCYEDGLRTDTGERTTYSNVAEPGQDGRSCRL